MKNNNTLEHRDNFQTSTKYKKIYSKDLKDQVKIIKMYFKVYLVQFEHYILIPSKAISGIEQ